MIWREFPLTKSDLLQLLSDPTIPPDTPILFCDRDGNDNEVRSFHHESFTGWIILGELGNTQAGTESGYGS